MTKEIIYAANPMCSWCYGFSPVIDRIRDEFEGRVDKFSLILGRLSHGEMGDDLRGYLRGCWDQVHERTGAKFDYGFFDREGFVYEPREPCRAVYIAKELGHSSDLDFRLFERLQRAFYQENQDITDLDILIRLASEVGISSEEFASRLRGGEDLEAMVKDFGDLERARVDGYPTILLVDEMGAKAINGYRNYCEIAHFIDRWIRGELMCPGHGCHQQMEVPEERPSVVGSALGRLSDAWMRFQVWRWRKRLGK